MKSIIKIVENINLDIYKSNESFVDNYNSLLEVSSVGWQTIIKFLDIVIWDEDNDERSYDENEEYEPLEPYLRKKIKNVIRELNKLEV